VKARMKPVRKVSSNDLSETTIRTLVSYRTPGLKLKNLTFGPEGFNYFSD